MGEFKAQGLANTAWAFATLELREERLFTTLAKAAGWRECEFNAQEFTIIAWAFAKVKQLNEKLFTVLTNVGERHMGEFNAQGLANTA